MPRSARNSGGALVDSQGRSSASTWPTSRLKAPAPRTSVSPSRPTSRGRAQELIQTGSASCLPRHQEPDGHPELQQQFGLTSRPGSSWAAPTGYAAAQAGLQQGDIIVKIDGKDVASDTDLYASFGRTSRETWSPSPSTATVRSRPCRSHSESVRPSSLPWSPGPCGPPAIPAAPRISAP